MIAFNEAFTSEKPFFNFLYVGSEGAYRRAISEKATGLNEVQNMAFAQNRDEVFPLIRKMRVGSYAGCLIVIWHASDGPADDILDQLESLGLDGQVAILVLCDEPLSITLDQRTRAVAVGVIGVGNLDDSLKLLASMCEECRALTCWPNLRSSSAKKPSRWIRNFHHDYLGNFLDRGRTLAGDPGLVDIQLDLYTLQLALLNIFVYPFHGEEGRFSLADHAGHGPLLAKLKSTPFELRFPKSLNLELDDQEIRSRIYQEQVPGAHPGGDQPVLTFIHAEQGFIEFFADHPGHRIVWVSDREIWLTWPEWQWVFSRGLLAAYSVEQLSRHRYRSLYLQKMPFWRSATMVSLPDAFQTITAFLEQTYSTLASKMQSEELLPVCRAWVEMKNAHALYLGSFTEPSPIEEKKS